MCATKGGVIQQRWQEKKEAILCFSQVLDRIQIDNFSDSITLRRIQENNSTGHAGEVWQITGDLSAPGSSHSADVDKVELMWVGERGEKKSCRRRRNPFETETVHAHGLVCDTC